MRHGDAQTGQTDLNARVTFFRSRRVTSVTPGHVATHMDTALTQATKSVEQFKLGAALMDGARVIAQGHNRNRNACGLHSIHAEMDALWKISKVQPIKNLHMVVVRLTGKGGNLACSKPCEACSKTLRRRGVRRVVYSTGDPHAPFAVVLF